MIIGWIQTVLFWLSIDMTMSLIQKAYKFTTGLRRQEFREISVTPNLDLFTIARTLEKEKRIAYESGFQSAKDIKIRMLKNIQMAEQTETSIPVETQFIEA
jgi:phage anti-repressor protein